MVLPYIINDTLDFFGLIPEAGEDPQEIADWLNDFNGGLCARSLTPEPNTRFPTGFVLVSADISPQALTQFSSLFDIDLQLTQRVRGRRNN